MPDNDPEDIEAAGDAVTPEPPGASRPASSFSASSFSAPSFSAPRAPASTPIPATPGGPANSPTAAGSPPPEPQLAGPPLPAEPLPSAPPDPRPPAPSPPAGWGPQPGWGPDQPPYWAPPSAPSWAPPPYYGPPPPAPGPARPPYGQPSAPAPYGPPAAYGPPAPYGAPSQPPYGAPTGPFWTPYGQAAPPQEQVPVPQPVGEATAETSQIPPQETTSRQPRLKPWIKALMAAGVLAVVVLVAAYFAGVFTSSPSTLPLSSDPALRAAANTAPKGTAPAMDIRAALRATEPGVVDIDSQGSSGQGQSQGTGMVLDSAGHILTNAHVVAGAGTVSVHLFGQGTSYSARVLAADTPDDIAVLQLDSPPALTPVPLGHSSGVLVGDPVIAIGNALGLSPGGPTVTHGIVSALDRTLNGGSISQRLTGLIQTSAAINPGNSGGPLVDAAGHVIAMNTAVSTDGQNIGFAIPIDAITPLLASLEKGQVPTRTQGFLGVNVTDAPPPGGAEISSITAGSPADVAGLKTGDVITAINNEAVAGSSDAAEIIGGFAPNAKVTIKYTRGGSSHTITVTLSDRPKPTPS